MSIHIYTGHLGTKKYMNQISHSMCIKGLGRKVRRVIATCEKCQKAKHPHIKYMTETRSHLPTAPGELCAVDLYGKLPTGRGGVKYIFVVVDVFSKYIALYALMSATTRSCLNNITEHYITRVTKPAKILSDNGTQVLLTSVEKWFIRTWYRTPVRPSSTARIESSREIHGFVECILPNLLQH
jgi:hypothetical protein